MRSILASIGILALLGASIVTASASSLRVAPTTIDMTAPASASVLNLRNDAKKPVNVQVRVFRWSQEGGKERLEPTTAVVASPPSTKLAPGQEYVVRVVRVSKAPVKGEESYRVLVDELPAKSEKRPTTVNLVVRHSIPVFFSQDEAAAPQVTWSVGRAGGRTMLTAQNNGSTRLKISDLTLSQGGKPLLNAKGLVGYVLGGSTMSFPINAKGASGALALKARSDMGPFDASVKAR